MNQSPPKQPQAGHHFIHHHRVRLHEVDGAGVLFYTQIFTLAHNGYEEMLLASGFSLQQTIQQGEYSIPLVHAEADYHHPVRLEDSLQLTIEVERIGESAFTLTTRVDNVTRGREQPCCAEVSTTHVTTLNQSGRPTPIPKPLLELLQQHG